MKSASRAALPPYGIMPRSFNEAMEPRNGFPESWRGDEAARVRFLEEMHDALALPLRTDDPWGLLEREIAMTIEVGGELRRAVHGIYGPTQALHVDLFRTEDSDETPLGSSIDVYCPGLAARLPVPLTSLTETAFNVYQGALDLVFKSRFQRLRPYQATQMIRQHDGDAALAGFSHEAVRTALSGSYPAGHCYQATVLFAFGWCRLRAMGVAFAPGELEGLATYVADIGERRMMAGLHYPLDSVGSWLLAREVIRHAFPEAYVEAALVFAAHTIRKSRVFAWLEGPARRDRHYKRVREHLMQRIPELKGRAT